MNIAALENFVFLPLPGHQGKGKLYVLGSRGGYRPNAFVLIPYVNPKHNEIAIHYYPILSSHELNLAEEVRSMAFKPIRPKPSLKKEEYIKKVEEIKK